MSMFDVRINNTEITLPIDRYTAEQHLCELELDLPDAQYSIWLVDGDGWLLKLNSNFRELNRLSNQLANMEEYERETLRAWIATHGGECTVEQALAASYQLEQLEFHPVYDDVELGEFALESDFFLEYNDLSDDVFDALDRAKIGARYREDVGGEFIANGFLMAGEIDFNATPSEEPLPWLNVEINEAADIAFCRSRLPQLHGLMIKTEKVHELHTLAEIIDDMNSDDMQKFRALLETIQPELLDEIAQLADTLHHYDVDLTLAESAAYGRQALADEYSITKEDLLLDFVDLEDFGAEHARLSGHVITRYGAVLASDEQEQVHVQTITETHTFTEMTMQ